MTREHWGGRLLLHRSRRDVQTATVRSTELVVINVNSLSVDSYQNNPALHISMPRQNHQTEYAIPGTPKPILKTVDERDPLLSNCFSASCSTWLNIDTTVMTHQQSAMLQRHPIRERFFWLVAVGIIHAVVILALCLVGRTTPPSPASDSLVAVFIQPKIRDQGAATTPGDLSRLIMRVQKPLAHLRVEQPEIIFDVARNNAAASAAPTLQEDGERDMQPFIKQAALLPGEGVTVVLRIEVMETGAPGRIEIDSSSGSAQVDQAALDYARTRHWYAGRVDGAPHPMWIRWGVRLQA